MMTKNETEIGGMNEAEVRKGRMRHDSFGPTGELPDRHDPRNDPDPAGGESGGQDQLGRGEIRGDGTDRGDS